MEALAYLAPFVAFLILYVGLRRRAARHGATPPIQWGWLAAIAACAAAAALLGLLV